MRAETQTTIIPPSSASKRRRGFTLTEIAIVLGIIGLILGAIWVAAASVYGNMRISTANTELLQVAQAVRSLYATSGTTDQTADMAPQDTAQAGNGLTYIRAGVFPTNALNQGSATTSTFTRNPWGGAIFVQSAQQVAGTNDSFVVVFNSIPNDACINLLTSSTGTGRDPGMWAVGGGARNGLPAQNALQPGTPFSAATANGVCANGVAGNPNNNAAGFWFNLRAGT